MGGCRSGSITRSGGGRSRTRCCGRPPRAGCTPPGCARSRPKPACPCGWSSTTSAPRKSSCSPPCSTWRPGSASGPWRGSAGSSEAEGPASPRDVIAAILTEALPADDERRTFTILYTAYFALSLTDPALAIGPLVRNSDAVIDVVAAQLRAAQAAGDTPARLDPDLEALSLLAMSAGLGTSILVGQSSPGQAQAVIDYHLDRLFPASRPALRRAPSEPVDHRPIIRSHRVTPARRVVRDCGAPWCGPCSTPWSSRPD